MKFYSNLFFLSFILVSIPFNNLSWGDPVVSKKCRDLNTLSALHEMVEREKSQDIFQLKRIVCQFPKDPPGTIKYPNGKIAFVGPEYSDKGSWKYPNGKFAYVGQYYQDKESWKYPNGKFAFIGPYYQDKGSWKYPNGKFAFVGPYYQDKGSWKWPNGKFAFVGPYYKDKQSWKYPNGKFAFVGPNYQDKDSWKYPNGKFAFVGPYYSNRDTLYYPNGKIYMKKATAADDASTIVATVEIYTGKQFLCDASFFSLPKPVQVMLRLRWIEETL